jgi:hypothetical protein
MVAGTKGEGTGLASVRSNGVGSASLFGVGHDLCSGCTGLYSLDRRALKQPLWWRERHVREVLWPMYDWSA